MYLALAFLLVVAVALPATIGYFFTAAIEVGVRTAMHYFTVPNESPAASRITKDFFVGSATGRHSGIRFSTLLCKNIDKFADTKHFADIFARVKAEDSGLKGRKETGRPVLEFESAFTKQYFLKCKF